MFRIIFALVLLFSSGITNAQVVVVPLGGDGKPSQAAFTTPRTTFVSSTPVVIRSITMTPKYNGKVLANSTAQANEGTAGHEVRCSITTGSVVDQSYEQQWDSPGSPASNAQLSGTRGFNVSANESITIRLVCDHVGGAANETSGIFDAVLTALFIPN